MWTEFRLKNFKGYQDTGLQILRPLTILIGPNGGGKSTLLKFLMMLKQTVENSDAVSTLITSVKDDKEGYVDLGYYKDYVFRGDTKSIISMQLSWQPTEDKAASEARTIFVEVEQPTRAKLQVAVKRLCYQGKDGKNLVSLTRFAKGTYKLDLHDNREMPKLKEKSREYEPEKFYRFSPALLADLHFEVEARLRQFSQDFEVQIRNTYYLGPLRDHPRRYYEAAGERPADLGIRGQKIDSVLYGADRLLMVRADFWLRRLGIAQSVSLSRISRGNIFNLLIRGLGQKSAVNLADYGFGASQILPIIVESLYSPPGSTILIEQPEIHLNARHQLKLPDFFAELVRSSQPDLADILGDHNKQFIIETHSEYFLKRLSTLVAKQTVKPDEVIVLYCSADENGSHIQPITLDRLGQYSWWPPEFLTEGYEGAAEHLEEMERIADQESGEGVA